MTSPRITVALSVYNNGPYLAAALDSMLAQSFGDFELLIVNDGSTDDSRAIIDSFAERDPRIRAVHQPNRGLIPSLNLMIAEARGEYIARMDGDDIALAERFARQVAFLDAHPDHGVVGTRVIGITETGEPRPDWTIDHPVEADAVQAALEAGPLLCHPSVMMRRSLVTMVGGYRAAYRHCEDYDLWLRLDERTRMANLPERLMLYRYSTTQVSHRHVLAQHYGAAVARLARAERVAGRPDPSEHWTQLPPVDELDAAFGRTGVAKAVRAEVTRGILYHPESLAGDGLPLIAQHVRDTKQDRRARVPGLWRAVARLARSGKPVAAMRLAKALAQG
ncbi:glycosyl transferase 2 family protein [Sphingomonas sp. S17]|uniref:Glycosyltransferase n=2 Tax=Sphingomonas paucimobilis TaxID=13689 RepID=A0A7T3ACT2_SPHPI|nr:MULTISPECIES: glycosyltransferase [Sphingomonas]EGI53793.1 glycosyl transferase 2 family protein [Sphingomonas sp. S17]MBQ1480487.1 glycosyltransferase [Sphingomonas sp.]MCM3680388.1 glycosyltransferase [Sphingomonas paucimobilis]MDG5970195.1 glycosyltransferase [Sphingomonas paucimobilis]QBE93015.1 glycosyltransferase [Sphingomonas paucimobilis]